MTKPPSKLTRPGKPELAYRFTPGGEALPPVMFMGGFRSDMEGTKATYFEKKCAERGQGYLRFDYSGHGASGGKFEDCTIGGWKQDALDVLDHAIGGPAILVGSSLGGWIALMIAIEREKQIKGVVGIASAPDFTRQVEDALSPAQRREMDEKGFVSEKNDYSPEPYIFTRKLIEEGKQHFLLGKRYVLDVPMRLVQGGEDEEVPWRTALAIEKVFEGGDVDVIIVDDGDHRLSRPEDIELIDNEIKSLSGIS